VVSDQIGSPTYASDLAESILNIIFNDSFNKKSFSTEIFHFANIGVTNWSQFAMEIFKFANLDCKVNPISSDQYPFTAIRPKNTTLSKEKIINQFKLQIPLWQQSLKDCLKKVT